MEPQTISKISKHFNISTRTLRYYEQIGLIQSVKKNQFSYRCYDADTVLRLQQIIVLRKLRIPLSRISEILQSEGTAAAIEIFEQNLKEIDDEIAALSTIKSVIQSLLERLHVQNGELGLLDDEGLLTIVESLTTSKIKFKEDKTMEDLNKAEEKLNKLTDKDVRIIYLPPSVVAAAHHIGEGGEGVVYGQISKFINENNLCERKPDLRAFGFNNPASEGDYGSPSPGYEAWVTIPDDLDVSGPLVKKQFLGGLYAAHMIPMGAFEEWGLFGGWLKTNGQYVSAWGEVRVNAHDPHMDWAMEEPLNFYNIVREGKNGADTQQLDLLFPIKPKFAASVKHPQERIVDTFKYNGMSVEVVEWDETIWCGKIGYQGETTNDPNVDWVQPILDGYFALDISTAKERIEPDWAVCINLNHLTSERPNGVMCADLVGTENQPDGFDVHKVPDGKYMRFAINDDSAKALGAQPWEGGMPPFEWVGEQLAPQFGYKYGDDRLPVFEYYGYYKPKRKAHEFRYLYVPVEKI
ncbi:MAG: effector binding domain-containing protein [Oscillospiraceae bacterium]|nr:effector binding domain-containing protein [Oscillospiraceae bacterium]